MLDIRSFWLIGAICALGFGFLLLIVRKSYPESLSRMLMFCSVASICLGAGWAILYEGPSAGQFAFLVVSRTMLALCLSLQYRAVSEIKSQPISALWIAGPPLLVFSVCTWLSFIQRNQSLLVILFSVIQLTVMVLLVRSLLRAEEGRRPLIDMVVAAVYSIFIVSTSVVVIGILLNHPLSGVYNFNNHRSIYNNIAAIPVFMTAFSMYPLMMSERLNRNLLIQASHDSLTGLYNRRAFEEIAFHEISGAARTKLTLSILVVDIDHFKKVNDEHGHSAGDALLKAVADALRRSLRDEDYLCRWGGDEFCALLPRADWDDARSVGERVLKTFRQLNFSFDGKAMDISVSIGITCDEDHAKDLPALLELADTALYRAKEAGRDGLAFALRNNPELG
jgi:diguanylate cyclase (GGDEF)-like protein